MLAASLTDLLILRVCFLVIHGSYNIAVLLLNKGADLNLKNRKALQYS